MIRAKRQAADLSALSCLAPELAEMLAAVACDIALVLDDGGVIRSVAIGGTRPVSETACAWVGQRWADTVTGDTRRKAEEFLDDLASSGVSRLRHLSHSSEAGAEIPVAYTAVRLGEQGPTLAVGRDLRAVTAMQQRLVASQQAMEADYWQRSQVETRHRLLFQVAAESTLVIDASTFEVIEANRSAALLLGRSVEELVGRPAAAAFAAAARAPLGVLLAAVASSQPMAEGSVDIAGGLGRAAISVTRCGTESSSVLLMSMRVLPAEPRFPDEHGAEERADAVFAALARRTPDAIVICGPEGRVTLANESFRRLVQWPAGHSMIGRELWHWMGADDTDGEGTVRGVLSTVKSDGALSLLLTRLRRPHERAIDVELSATLLVGTDSVGFIVRVAHQQDTSGTASDQDADRNLH